MKPPCVGYWDGRRTRNDKKDHTQLSICYGGLFNNNSHLYNEEEGWIMNILVILFYIWVGIYWYAILYLKQVLFQGKDAFESPLKYLKDFRFVFSVLAVMLVAQVTWLLDAWVREKLKLSQTYALTSLIVAPISAIVMFTTLWLSEKHLGDKVIWWAAILIIIGTALNTIGGAFLLGGQK